MLALLLQMVAKQTIGCSQECTHINQPITIQLLVAQSAK